MVKVRCIDPTKDLNFGWEYEVLGDSVTCYAVRNDAGKVVNYSKNRFEGVVDKNEA